MRILTVLNMTITAMVGKMKTLRGAATTIAIGVAIFAVLAACSGGTTNPTCDPTKEVCEIPTTCAADDFDTAGCDGDGDGVNNGIDNCPDDANPDQLDSDAEHSDMTLRDGLGDACDLNDDGDSVNDDVDVDDDNDGLIELSTEDDLHYMRWDLDGSHYDIDSMDGEAAPTGTATVVANSIGDNRGCPSAGCIGYEMINDVALTGRANWEPISNLTAVFEGNGYTIIGLNIQSSSSSTRVGFFDRASLVRNVHIAGRIAYTGSTASAVSIGGLAANTSNIYNSGASVDVTISDPSSFRTSGIGGLIGIIEGAVAGNVRIRNSWAGGDVGSTAVGGIGYSIGGLIGNDSHEVEKIENVYATGDITGGSVSNFLGGLIGQFNRDGSPELANSYATGDVTGGHTDDVIGGIVAIKQSSSPGFAATSQSYYSGTVASVAGATSAVFTGITMQTPELLRAPMSNTGIYSRWSANDWNYGTASQLPALTFADHTTPSGVSETPDCTPLPEGKTLATLPLRPGPRSQPYCGKLLPCQEDAGRIPADERTRCGLSSS